MAEEVRARKQVQDERVAVANLAGAEKEAAAAAAVAAAAAAVARARVGAMVVSPSSLLAQV